MLGEEPDNLPADLQNRAVGVEVEPVYAVDLQADMLVSTSLMFTTLAMPQACIARAGLSGPELTKPSLAGGAAGRGAAPLPLITSPPVVTA
jgi:hypothetical protein